MAQSECIACGGILNWNWEEAFDKFGFSDGASAYLTQVVVRELEKAGYDVRSAAWGCHNEIITDLAKDGRELIAQEVSRGYDDPRGYLPREVVALLDRIFPQEEVIS